MQAMKSLANKLESYSFKKKVESSRCKPWMRTLESLLITTKSTNDVDTRFRAPTPNEHGTSKTPSPKLTNNQTELLPEKSSELGNTHHGNFRKIS